MGYRCKYVLTSKMVVAAAEDAPAGHFDDVDHGTTILFSGILPQPFEKTYDDVAEVLNSNADYGTYLDLSTNAVDWDKDGIADAMADGVHSPRVDIQKKDSNGNDLTGAEHDDIIFVSTSAGSLSESLVSLVNGAATVFLDPSVDVGCKISITAKSKKSGVGPGNLAMKFVEEGTSSSSL